MFNTLSTQPHDPETHNAFSTDTAGHTLQFKSIDTTFMVWTHSGYCLITLPQISLTLFVKSFVGAAIFAMD